MYLLNNRFFVHLKKIDTAALTVPFYTGVSLVLCNLATFTGDTLPWSGTGLWPWSFFLLARETWRGNDAGLLVAGNIHTNTAGEFLLLDCWILHRRDIVVCLVFSLVTCRFFVADMHKWKTLYFSRNPVVFYLFLWAPEWYYLPG